MRVKINYYLRQDNEDAIKIDYKGILRKIDNSSYELVYNVDKTKNILTINRENNTLTMQNDNLLYFEEGIINNVEYKTAFGFISLKLKCDMLKIAGDDKNITINIKYDLIQGNVPLKNELEIKIAG